MRLTSTRPGMTVVTEAQRRPGTRHLEQLLEGLEDFRPGAGKGTGVSLEKDAGTRPSEQPFLSLVSKRPVTCSDIPHGNAAAAACLTLTLSHLAPAPCRPVQVLPPQRFHSSFCAAREHST